MSYDITYIQNLKTEIDPQTQKTNLWLPKGKDGRGRDKLGVYIYTLLCIKYKIDNQQGPIVQYIIFNISELTHKGKESKKKKKKRYG